MAEDDFYAYNMYPVISHYFTCLEETRAFNKWAGHYDLNTIDGSPYIFEDSGLIVAGGTSGSGMMKADAIGRIVAAAQVRKDIATLNGGKHFRVAKLGIETRRVEPEEFVIYSDYMTLGDQLPVSQILPEHAVELNLASPSEGHMPEMFTASATYLSRSFLAKSALLGSAVTCSPYVSFDECFDVQ